MPVSSKSQLKLISIRDLVNMELHHELGVSQNGRGPWQRKQKIEFLEYLNNTSIFQAIILSDCRSEQPGSPLRYRIFDGARRIDAILEAFCGNRVTGTGPAILFDLRRYNFVTARKSINSDTRIFLGDLIWEEAIGSIEESLRSTLKTTPASQADLLPIKNLWQIARLLDLQIPAYIVEADASSYVSMFDDINSTGLPLRGHCPNGYPDCPKIYRKAGKFDRTRLAAIPGLSSPGSAPISAFPFTDSIETTVYAPLFGGRDLECRVSLVPRKIVDRLAVDLPQLTAYIGSVLERADEVLELPPDGLFNPAYVKTAAAELEDCLGKVLDDEGFYNSEVLTRISHILMDLIHHLNNAAAAMQPPLKPLLLRTVEYDGVFIDHDIPVGPVVCRAGIFMRNDIPEKKLRRVIDHELAHAYFRANKTQLLDCPWIEEGLAEWCSGYLAGSFQTGSRFAFYDFLDVLAPLPIKDIQAIAGHWLRGSVPVSWWCRFVKNRKLPPAAGKASSPANP